MTAPDDDLRSIRLDEFLPHPPSKVWKALTDSELMGRWLMPNDFKLEVGHDFNFQGRPIPQAGFGGTGYSRVLDFETEKMLKISWCAAPDDESDLESTVTFTLEPEGTGTRLFLVHDGFDPGNAHHGFSRRFMGQGWPGVLKAISTVIEQTAAGR